MSATLRTRSLLTAALAACLVSASAATTAQADIVRVVITGFVESNGYRAGTTFFGVPSNTPVTVAFDLNSANFIASPTPSLVNRVRGYPVIPGSFSLQVGTVTVGVAGTPAFNFVIRNDDPRVDGFFISAGTDLPTFIRLAMTPANHGLEFSRTFNNPLPPPALDPTLPSLNILDAVGSWGFENLSVYSFNVGLNENITPLVLGYSRITISNITPRCLADVAGGSPSGGDGTVDGADFIAFVNSFAIGSAAIDATADVAGGTSSTLPAGGPDGTIDGTDFIEFINAFAAGC